MIMKLTVFVLIIAAQPDKFFNTEVHISSIVYKTELQCLRKKEEVYKKIKNKYRNIYLRCDKEELR